jgi:hypothetical protein
MRPTRHRASGSTAAPAASPSRAGANRQVLTADAGETAGSEPESAALREGWRLYGQGSLAEARRLMMIEAASSPEDPESAYLLGMIFKARGEAENAVRAFAAVTRTVSKISNRTRSEMLRRLASANLELLTSSSTQESNRSP